MAAHIINWKMAKKTQKKLTKKEKAFRRKLYKFEREQRKLGNWRDDITWDDLEHGLKNLLQTKSADAGS